MNATIAIKDLNGQSSTSRAAKCRQVFAQAVVAGMVSLIMLVLVAWASPASAQSRIKDIVDVEGVRDNMLVGYGLVVGLGGTGDSIKTGHFTQQIGRAHV